MKELIKKLEKIITYSNNENVKSVISQAIQALQQSESKIDKAIKKFEEAKSKSESLRDVVYLDGVLAVLDTIKNEPTPPNE